MKNKKMNARERGAQLANSSTERRKIFKNLCRHVAQGFSLESFPELSDVTILKYLSLYPEEFIQEELDQAKRQGRVNWELIGRKQATGECMGNSRSWYYNMANRYGWRERVEVEAEHKGQVNINVVDYATLKRSTDMSESE